MAGVLAGGRLIAGMLGWETAQSLAWPACSRIVPGLLGLPGKFCMTFSETSGAASFSASGISSESCNMM